MASNDDDRSRTSPGGRSGGVDDALVALEQRLDRASAAAERLLADAVTRIAVETGGGEAAAAASGGRVADEPDPSDAAASASSASSASSTSSAGSAGFTAGAGPRTPPSGYQPPAGEPSRRGPLGDDGDLLLALLHSVRDRIPPDLQRRLAEAVREVLLAVRALIDWYLERSERQRSEPTPIRDIPIL